MKMLFISLIALSLSACGTAKKASDNAMNETTENTNPKPDGYTPMTHDVVKVKAVLGDVSDQHGDPITIESAEIRQNLLYLTVSYSGGCEDHDFEVIGSNMIAKSMPPIRGIVLGHHANGDACRELVTKILEINIKDLAYQQVDGSQIILTLEGWKERLEYTYVANDK